MVQITQSGGLTLCACIISSPSFQGKRVTIELFMYEIQSRVGIYSSDGKWLMESIVITPLAYFG